jgi:hypothetical protein
MPSLRGYFGKGKFLKKRPFHKNRAVNLHFIMKNRPERLICFLVVWLTMFSFKTGWGQNPYASGVSGRNMAQNPGFNQVRLPGEKAGFVSRNKENSGIFDLSGSPVSTGFVGTGSLIKTIPPNIFYLQSGAVCKMEWKLEKATRIPFRFRLGSLADCNALEGKH